MSFRIHFLMRVSAHYAALIMFGQVLTSKKKMERYAGAAGIKASRHTDKVRRKREPHRHPGERKNHLS